MNITKDTIDDYLLTIDPKQYSSMVKIIDIFKEITNLEPKLWGTIVGVGNLYYKYKSGHEGYMPLLGVAARKNNIALYLTLDLTSYPGLDRLGKFTMGKSCLYIKHIDDINVSELKKFIKKCIEDTLNLDFIKVIP